MTRKEQLIIELTKELSRFRVSGMDTTDHELTINYLKSGHIDGDPEQFDLLDSAINDIECLYNDYLNN